ncbi:serine/threonine-protein kinase Nek4-like isoform X3 [Portunus trituberculatus]|uniref:serine/threonine-protein kinase Nek4-like isoform X3 n=1 Tax=Portunus trituberculatus TaxID=210409 RepID=UPI001E1D1EFB|nr:serine/threonine-protein kinase Nek4-like isoform X3 [Portunus trituberculatus]
MGEKEIKKLWHRTMKTQIASPGKLVKEKSEPEVILELESEEVEAGELILPLSVSFIHCPGNHHFYHFLGHQLPALPLACLLHQVFPASASEGCSACQTLLRKDNDSHKRKRRRKARLRSHGLCSTQQETRNVCATRAGCYKKERCLRNIGGTELLLSPPVSSLHSPDTERQLTSGSSCEVASPTMTTVEGIEVVREIGRGNYGSVWLVRQPGSSKNLVLKCVDLTHCSVGEVEAARQEVRILAGLRHPNIVSYKGSFEVGRRLNLLMGYCAGGDMASLIKRQRGQLFPEVKIVRWLIQITMALQYLHNRRILHRDLKTRNIFLTRSGLIKLGDFGIARILGSSHDMATTLVGTPYYMSPELFAGLPYNHKSDVWALGCCLYELATLKHAFPARDIPGLISKISKGKIVGLDEQYSDDLRHLVLSLMTRSPEHRLSASQILRLPYIRQHMSLFLKDTSDNAEEINGSEKLPTEKKILPDVLQDSGMSGVQSSLEGKQPPNTAHENVGQHKHLVARRCCEIIPSEFESLQIAGDKIKLEERDRSETKPSGTKECHCSRKEKLQQHSCNSGHLHSQSRARRRDNREVEESGDSFQDHLSPSVVSSLTSRKTPIPPHSSLSARERRRQQRRGENENGRSSTSGDGHKGEKDDSESSSSQSPTEDSDEYSNSDTSTATPPQGYEEDFLQSLSSTLTETSSPSEGESEQTEEDNVGHLEATIAKLEDYLVTKMGKVQGRLVINVLKEEDDDDEVEGNWEARLREVEQLVGSKLDPDVATTAWHLHLCYVLQHT